MGDDVTSMGQRLRVRIIDIDAGRPIVLLHEIDAEKISVRMGDRLVLCKNKRSCGEVGIVDVTDTMVSEGEIGVFNDLAVPMKLSPGSRVLVSPRAKPESVNFIRRKIDGKELSGEQINLIIEDIVRNNLSDIELTSFVTASAIHGFSWKETVALTWSMVNTGDRLDFEGDVIDKHCIGGVPGNRTTMLIVPMLASLGLKIPKTSSRAITSPSGTADTMEVLAPVNYDAKHVSKFVNKAGGCIVWGGAVNLAPADDKIIRVEYPLSLDPEGQVLASIMSKKKSVGSDYVLVDIPYGPGSKILEKERANQLGKRFVELGKEIEMNVKYILTDGSQPIGRGIGPVLEAKDVLTALDGNGPNDLVEKSAMMVGEILEFCGAASKGKGLKMAKGSLGDGSAKRKMEEIIKLQGGNPRISPRHLKPGRCRHTIKSNKSGRINMINNKLIASIARASGSPKDAGAGVFLEAQVGDSVEKGEALFTIYSNSKPRLGYALDLVGKENPFWVE
jgi:AMP phosphorylase